MNPELDEKLSALLDGELAPEEAAALRAELARSPELAVRLEALAAVDAGLRALPDRSVPPGVRARVAEELRTPPANARTPSAARRVRRVRRWLAAAALAAAAAWLTLLVLPRSHPHETPVASSEAEDLPVIQVLDVLVELDELEPVGSG
jgi:anti-sigma factor RsiW